MATADEHYAVLRRNGRILLAWDEAGVVPGLRRRAKADGLLVSANRESRGRKGAYMTRDQSRRRATTVCLTRDGVTIVAPDAGKDA